MDYSSPGSSVLGISQARIVEWVPFSFSSRSSQPRDWTWVSLTVTSLVAQMVKCLPAMQETRVQSLGQENLLEILFFWLHSVWQILASFASLFLTNFVLFMAESYSFVYMYHSFFIHSPVIGHVGSFHVLTIANIASVNIGVHVCFWIMIFSGYMGLPGHMIVLFLV